MCKAAPRRTLLLWERRQECPSHICLFGKAEKGTPEQLHYVSCTPESKCRGAARRSLPRTHWSAVFSPRRPQHGLAACYFEALLWLASLVFAIRSWISAEKTRCPSSPWHRDYHC